MKTADILTLAEQVYPAAVSYRRYFHENPEAGNKEYNTTAFIVKQLESFGISVERPLETGAVGILRCGEGKTVALRADIDALPVTEETGLEFSSKVPGLMHACGHDIHTAALLAAAKALSEHKDELHGTVKFIFQPDEEGFGGADRLVKCGVLKDADAVFGIHIRPELPAGSVAVKFGKSYAASDIFEVTVTGKSCHGAEPHNGKNALLCASEIALSLEGLVSRTVSPTDSAVVSVCTLESGTACNIIPETAVLSGIIRSLGAETRKLLKTRLSDCCEAIAKSRGCTVTIKLHESYPGVVNSDRETQIVKKVSEQLFSGENTLVLSEPTMTTEDFGYYLEKAGGCFYHVGAGCDFPLHNSKMSPDESCLKTACSMHIALVNEYLGQ